jgi:signal transduction histidine kinase
MQVAGFSFALSGAVLWLRRPAGNTGLLMITVGVTWYIGDLQLIDQPILFAFGFCLFYINIAVMAHLVLALPTGRLNRRYERGLVAAVYLAVPLTQVPRLIAEYPPKPQAWGDPRSPQSIWAPIGSMTILILTVLVVVLIARRWSASARPVRRQYALVWAAILSMGLIGVVYTLAALFNASFATQQLLLLAHALALVLTPVAIAAGLLRVQMARLRVAQLITHLEKTADPDEVQTAIAYALDDPSLEVCFPLPGDCGYVHADGHTATLPTGRNRASTTVERHGNTLAVLVHDTALQEHQTLIDAVVAAASLALDNARLLAAERAQLEQVRASRARIVMAADSERRRIQRDLHDGVQHKLLAVAMRVEQARAAQSPTAACDFAGAAVHQLNTAANELREVILELRALSEGIHPPALTEQGLAAAAEILAERASLPVHVDADDVRWPEPIERVGYFVITESLANVYKHANASSVHVRITGSPRVLVVAVTDDGDGGADPTQGTGLLGLHDRVSALGGTLRLESLPGAGTSIAAELPCES